MKYLFDIYKLVPLAISFLVAIDFSGDWGNLFSGSGLPSLQPLIFVLLFFYILITSPRIIRGFSFTPLSFLLFSILTLNCVFSILSGVSFLSIILDLPPVILFPILSQNLRSSSPIITSNIARISLTILLSVSLCKVFFYFIVMGPLAFSAANLTKLSPALGIYFLSLYTCGLIFDSKVYSLVLFSRFALLSGSILLFVTQQRTLFLLTIFLLFVDILSVIFRLRIKRIYLLFISVFLSLIFLQAHPAINLPVTRLTFANSFSPGNSFFKRAEVLSCLLDTPAHTLFLGNGLGSPIQCSEDSSGGYTDGLLRKQQTELEIPALIVRLGLITSILVFAVYVQSISLAFRTSSLENVLPVIFLSFSLYSSFQSLFLSVYFQWVLFLVLFSVRSGSKSISNS